MPAIDCRTASEKLDALKALKAEFEAAIRVYAASGKKTDQAAVYAVKARYDAASADLRDALFEARFPNAERRIIEIGGKTAQEYEQELVAQGHKLSDWAKDILAKIPTSKERQDIITVRLTVKDLGFKEAATHEAIVKRAEELGLELCPAEVGPMLRLVMKDQPMGDRAVVAMEAIAERRGDPLVFYIARNDHGSWLSANGGRPGRQWDPYDPFVFVLRKQ